MTQFNRNAEEAPRSYSFSGVADSENQQKQGQNANEYQQDNYGYNYQNNYYDGNPEQIEGQYNQQAQGDAQYGQTQEQQDDQSGRHEEATNKLEIHAE